MTVKHILNRIKLNYLGYVKLPVLPKEDMKLLCDFYNNNIFFDEGIFNSIMSPHSEIRLQHDQIIRNTLSPYLSKYIANYKIIMGTFFSKKNDTKADVGPHQDPSTVDYTKFDDFIIWIPLVDTTLVNSGRIKLLKKSHHKYSKINFVQHNYCFDYLLNFKKKLLPLNLKKGEVVLFYNRLIHSSETNTIYKERPAISMKITSKEADIMSFHMIDWEKGILDLYRQNDDYYLLHGWDEKTKPACGAFFKRTTFKKF